jgi:hypothetical protein
MDNLGHKHAAQTRRATCLRQQQPGASAASVRMSPGLVQQGCAAIAEDVSRVGMMIVGERKYSTKLGILRSKSTTHLHEKKFE